MAAKQYIRKVETASTIDFDEQQWPINVALLILGAFVAGIVVAASDFEDPRVLYNGWVRVFGVLLTMGLLFGGVMYMQRRMMRRVQLCVLVSLLFHLWLALYLHQHYLRLMAQEEARRSQQEQTVYEPTTMPDYNPEQLDRPEIVQSFEEPVETQAPVDAEQEPLEQENVERPLPTIDKPEVEPVEAQRQQPSPAEMQRAELSAPRRADQAAGGKVSRQEWKQRPLPDEPIPQPEIRPPGEQPNRPLVDQVASVQRREARIPRQERQTFDEPSAQRQFEVAALARSARESQPTPERPTTPAPTRQLTQPAEVAQTDAPAPQPVQAVEPLQPAELKPALELIAQRQSDPSRSIVGKRATEPMPVAATATTQAATEHRRADQRPELAQNPQPRPTRRVQQVEVPAESASREPRQSVAEAAPSDRPLTPAESAMSRQVAQTGPSRVATPLPEAPAPEVSTVAAASVVAESQPRRADRTAPSPAQSALAPRRVARQIRAADQPTPSDAMVTALAQAAAPSATAAEPSEAATIAVARVPSARTTGGASREAAGQSLPAASHRAELPSAVARRAEASQPRPSVDNPSTPARPSTLARSTQGAQLPSTAIPVDGAMAAAQASPGSTPASQVDATSNVAAVTRSASQAPRSTAVAAAGSADFAVGAGQVTTRTGQPRATDMAQPSLAESSPAPRPARANVGVSVGATPTPEVAPVPSIAAAQPGGMPSPVMAASAVAVSRSGQAASPISRPNPGAGPEADRGASAKIGVSQPTRITRVESTPEGMSGGGSPSPARSSVGREVATDLPTEPMPSALAKASAGGQQGSPVEANVQGQQQQVAGLPGSERSRPLAGAAASHSDHGESLPVAVARRATAAQISEAAPGLRPEVAATLARSPRGIDLPAAATATDQTPTAGPGGIAATSAAAPSSLEPGQVATVQRTSDAEAPAGNVPVAAGSAEFSVGTARIVALAGQLASGERSLPTPAAASGPSSLGRTIASATIPIADVADPIEAMADAQPAAGSAAADPGEAAFGAVTSDVARTAGSGLPAANPTTSGDISLNGPESEIAAAMPRRRGSSDVVLASAEGAAVSSPTRTVGRIPVADALADAPAATSIAAAAGEPNSPAGGTLQAAEIGPQRRTPGLPGNPTQSPAADMATQPGPTATTPGTTPGPRRLPDGREDGPILAAAVGGAPISRSSSPGLPRGLTESAKPEPVAVVGGAEAGLAIALTEGALAGEPSRREGGLPVQIAALPGPGGLSFNPSPEVGLPSRRASRESEVVHNVSGRFVVERSGGELAIDGTVNEPTEGYRHRMGSDRSKIAQARGGSEGTERAVEMGLDFLARLQFPDGRWSLHQLPPGVSMPDPALGNMQADTAATGLALLTYLGAGYTHLDDKHRTIVDKGLAWLVRNQKPNGDLFTGGSRPVWFYSHGIAAIAMCEAYGMTQDPELREPAQLAVRFICETQHPTRGGWRYDLDSQGRSRESDTSVSGWQLMALKSAQMAGLEVPPEVLAKVNGWLDIAQASQVDGQYVYNPHAADSPEQRAGRNPNLAMTAEGMLMRIYLGRNRDNARLATGADFLRNNLPEVGTSRQPLRDCYYWYYATQAMFQMQEPYWTDWNDRLRPIMEAGQEQAGPPAGSWHPIRPVPDRWGHAGGRLYVTAMHLLMLEVYYRHLPLFQELSR